MQNKANQPDNPARPNHVSARLDWDTAMRIAGARLSDRFTQPGAANDPRLTGAVAALAWKRERMSCAISSSKAGRDRAHR